MRLDTLYPRSGFFIGGHTTLPYAAGRGFRADGTVDSCQRQKV